MPLTVARPANTIAGDFIAAEVTHLMAWADQHGLDVAIKPASADVAHEAAVVRCAETVASWAIFRTNGHLWLDFTADWTRQEFRGWGVEVTSIAEAAERIIFNIERHRGAASGQHHA